MTIMAKDPNNHIIAKPFVKWAGGKGALIKHLIAHLPSDFAEQQDVTYIEPFVGGGAIKSLTLPIRQRYKFLPPSV